jgi:hypothetical protein
MTLKYNVHWYSFLARKKRPNLKKDWNRWKTTDELLELMAAEEDPALSKPQLTKEQYATLKEAYTDAQIKQMLADLDKKMEQVVPQAQKGTPLINLSLGHITILCSPLQSRQPTCTSGFRTMVSNFINTLALFWSFVALCSPLLQVSLGTS